MTDKDNTELDEDQVLEEDEVDESEGADDTEKKVTEESEEADDTEDQGEEGEESDDEEGADKFEDTDKPEIPVRDAIIRRQRKTIEKLRSKQAKEEESESDDDEEEVEEDDDNEIGSVIDRKLDQRLQPITERLAREAEDQELSDLFRNDPEAKGFEKAIRAFMKHPAWAQVPLAAIYHHLAFAHAQKKGAQQRQIADAEAAQTRGSGSQRRSAKAKKTNGVPTAEEIDAMSDEELDELAHKVQTGQFK